jgi:hypothetical protein
MIEKEKQQKMMTFIIETFGPWAKKWIKTNLYQKHQTT